MGPKIIPGYGAHGDSHPALYEGNHRDYYLSLLPVFVPLSLFIVPNIYFQGDPILSPKVFYPLLGVYYTLKSTHFQKGLERTKKVERRKWSQGEEMYETQKNIWKNRMQRFMKTYRNKEGVLGQTFSICRGISKLRELAGSVYVRQS